MQKFEITIGPVLQKDLGNVLQTVLAVSELVSVNPCVSKPRKPYTRKGRITNDDKKLMRELREKGKTLLEIASVIGCSDETVRRHLAAMGLNYDR